MEKFRIGNVVKLDGSRLVIITSVDSDTTFWVSFDSSNCSGATRNKSYIRMEACFCCENNDGEYDTECKDCKGNGEYPEEINGMVNAKYLADNVKAYIMNKLTKNFDF